MTRIVLVHGAWADSSSWSGVVERLQRDGHVVHSIPNQLRGLAGDSAYVAGFLQTIREPVVLVGHSYGGAVVSNAATGNPNVKALVYVDGFAPDQGENVLQLAPGSALEADPATVFDFAPYPGAPDGDFDAYIKQSLFPSTFANDLPTDTGRTLGACQRPAALSALQEASGAPAWKTIDSWYVLGKVDKVIPPPAQRTMAERAHSRITEIDASHLSMVSHPDEVARVIVAAVQGAMATERAA